MITTHQHRIAHIASGDLWAGAEMQVYTLATASLDNFKVYAVVLNEGLLAQRLREQGIEVIVINEQEHGLLSIVSQVKQVIRDHDIDFLHTHGYKENVIGAFAGFQTSTPSLRTVHGDNEFRIRLFSPKQSLPALLDWFTGRWIQSTLVAVSDELADKLKKKYPAKKITMIANGINIDALAATLEPPEDIDFSPDCFNIAFVGRLVPLKRVDLIIDGFCLLQQQAPSSHKLFIIGEGPEKQALEQRAKESGCVDSIHFLGHRGDVHQLIKAMDCLVMASDHEGLPMTVLEAVALQVPVVSHAVGAIPDVLDQGRCGYLFHEQTPAALAEALKACELNADKDKVSEQALIHLREHYSHKKNAESYAKLYRDVLQ